MTGSYVYYYILKGRFVFGEEQKKIYTIKSPRMNVWLIIIIFIIIVIIIINEGN